MMQPQIQQSKILKRLCKGSDWFRYDELTLIFWLFFVDCRYEEQTRSKLCKTVKSHRENMVAIVLEEIDFDDPTTNVR